MIDFQKIKKSSVGWTDKSPFPYFVVDDFLDGDIAKSLELEFPAYKSDVWHVYSNPIEEKKTCNNWNEFPPLTYRVFQYLNSSEFVSKLSDYLFEDNLLSSDPGLNGGGWHIHSRSGKLNPHLDYSLHPKLHLQRKVNIIIYLNSSWENSWGGGLGLWRGNSKKPKELIDIIEPKFNRAVVFDTTCNSWHGLPDQLLCPKDEYRKSIAVYYLTKPSKGTDTRSKALFAPSEDQIGDNEIIELIKTRSLENKARDVWISKIKK